MKMCHTPCTGRVIRCLKIVGYSTNKSRTSTCFICCVFLRDLIWFQSFAFSGSCRFAAHSARFAQSAHAVPAHLGICIPKEKQKYLRVRFWLFSKSLCGPQTFHSAKSRPAQGCVLHTFLKTTLPLARLKTKETHFVCLDLALQR